MHDSIRVTVGASSSIAIATKNLLFLLVMCIMCRQMTADRRYRPQQRRHIGCLAWLCRCLFARRRGIDNGRPLQWFYMCSVIKRKLTEKKRRRDQKKLLNYIIEVKEFRVHQGTEYEQDRCTICLEGFIDKQEVCSLACRHIFHKKCIANWLKNKERPNMNCPVCAKNIIPVEAIPGVGNPQDLDQEFLNERLAEVEKSDTQAHPNSTNASIEMTTNIEV